MPCCPHNDRGYRGWLGLDKLRANGPPSGGPGVSSVVLGTQLASEQVLEAYRVWRLTEVLLSHVLPWRQAQIV
jgi:hypothetical protein